MGRNKLLSLVAAALLIIGLFLPYLGDLSLFKAMSLPMGAGIVPIFIGILILLYTILVLINQPLLARICAVLTLLMFAYAAFGPAGGVLGIGVWIILAGAALGTLFSKKDA
jgi:hypothetical protein